MTNYLERQAVGQMIKVMEALVDHLPPLTMEDGSSIASYLSREVYYDAILKIRDGIGLGRSFPPEVEAERKRILNSLVQTLP